jgi:hypothetical protein
MKTIHRYTLDITDRQDTPMPSGAIPLHLAAGYLDTRDGHHPIIELWCAVDTEIPTASRSFAVVGTGRLADVEPFTYIGTVIHARPDQVGRGVWHVFDLGEEGER